MESAQQGAQPVGGVQEMVSQTLLLHGLFSRACGEEGSCGIFCLPI